MQVTVLGKSPAWQDAAGACSGYLIRHDGFTLLLDCGNGVFAKLRSYVDYAAVDAVVITHLHADHCFDLLPFSYALTIGPRAGAVHPSLYAPPGAEGALRGLGGWVGDEKLILDAFEIEEYDVVRPRGASELRGVKGWTYWIDAGDCSGSGVAKHYGECDCARVHRNADDRSACAGTEREDEGADSAGAIRKRWRNRRGYCFSGER